MAAAQCSGLICRIEAAAIFVIQSECNERRDLRTRGCLCHPEAVKPLVGSAKKNAADFSVAPLLRNDMPETLRPLKGLLSS